MHDSIAPLFDIDAVRALLTECGLPTTDLAQGRSADFLGLADRERVIAVVGLEALGQTGLLRSLAVAPEHRGRGLAQRLVAAIEAEATSRGITTLYLLTQGAADFFRRLGYRPATREDAPAAIRATAQFSGLCPASAAFLCKQIAAVH